MKNLLIVTDIWPTDDLTAGIATRKLVNHLNEYATVHLLVCANKSLASTKARITNTGFNFFTLKPNEYWAAPKLLKTFLAPIIDILTFLELNKLLRICRKKITELNPDHLVFILQGQAMILTCNSLKKLDIPYTTLTWDPWKWWSEKHFVTPKINRRVEIALNELYSTGFHLVPTKNMAEHRRIEQNRFQVIYFPESNVNTVLKKQISPDKIRIVFAGGTYVEKEIDSFISSLSRIGWVFENSSIYLHIFGNTKNFNHPHVIQHGWKDSGSLPELLSNFDLALLPYPFDEKMLETATQSFPSKLSTYCAAGLPVIYFGPAYGSPVKSIKNSAVLLTDFNILEGILLSAFGNLQSNYQLYSTNARLLYSEYMSEQAFNQQIFNWVEKIQLFDYMKTDLLISSKPFVFLGPKVSLSYILIRFMKIITFNKRNVLVLSITYFRVLAQRITGLILSLIIKTFLKLRNRF
jgi:hypothetical protein